MLSLELIGIVLCAAGITSTLYQLGLPTPSYFKAAQVLVWYLSPALLGMAMYALHAVMPRHTFRMCAGNKGASLEKLPLELLL